MFFLVPVTTSVVTASTVPLEEVPDSSTVVTAPPVLPVMVPAPTTVAPVPPAPSIEVPDASVGAAVSLVHASSQEDSDVPLSRFLVRSTGSVTVSPRVGEDGCPPPEKLGGKSWKVIPEKEAGKNSKTSPSFSRFLPNFAETFSRLETSQPPVQGRLSVTICFGCFFIGVVCSYAERP